jgi:glycosyltransferase involved in cell wall biosynthesis
MAALSGRHVVLLVENQSVPFDRRMWNIGTALRDFGAKVSVICPSTDLDHERAVLLEGISIHRYKAHFSDGTVRGYLWEYATAFAKTMSLLHKLLFGPARIHVVHVANPPDIFWPLALYLRLFGVRFIFDEHDLAPETYLSRFEKRADSGGLLLSVQRAFERLSYSHAHAIISTNESYRQNALRADPRHGAKTFVVRNGPDTRQFNPRPHNPALKRDHKYLAAFIGTMAVQDGVDYIIRAMDELVNRRNYRDLIVYLMGAGDDWNRLRRLTNDLHLEDYIVFTGIMLGDHALEVLSTADICLSPDPSNPLNDKSTMTKIMEYMALGKPIVSFDLKEARYSAAESALYVKNNDPVAFADGIVTLLEDPVRCKKMGEAGRSRVDAALSWQLQTPHLLNAYQFVVSGQR